MKTIYLTKEQSYLETLIGRKLSAYLLSDGAMPDLRDAEIIVVGKKTEGKKAALELASRGISQTQLSYIEPNGETPWSELLRKPRHLWWDDARPLAEAPNEERTVVYACGIPSINDFLKWRLPELCVTAGPYGSGKSLWAQILAMNFIAENGEDDWGNQDTIYRGDSRVPEWPKIPGCSALLCSWEDMPSKLRSNASKIAIAKGFKPDDLLSRVHYVCRDPNEDRLVAWFIDLVRYYVKRYNTRKIVLDPWNEVDHIKDNRQLETDYIRDMMKAFRRLVDELQIILNIVTHVPAKMINGDNTVAPFRLAHAHGSVQFGNKADRGFCVSRTKSLGGDHMATRFDKVKIEPDMGKQGCAAFTFDGDKCELRYDGEASGKLREAWGF